MTTRADGGDRPEDSHLALETFDDDYDRLEHELQGALRELDSFWRLTFAWSVCEHLAQVVENLPEEPHVVVSRLRSVLDDGWNELAAQHRPKVDAEGLEELVPTDSAGVGLGDVEVGEISDLVLCLSLALGARDGSPPLIARAAVTAVSALWSTGQAQDEMISAQGHLLDQLKNARDLPVEQIRAKAGADGRRIAQAARNQLRN